MTVPDHKYCGACYWYSNSTCQNPDSVWYWEFMIEEDVCEEYSLEGNVE